MNILHVDCSILGPHSVSRKITGAIVARLKEIHPDSSVVYRDLVTTPVPSLPPPVETLADVSSDPVSLELEQALAQLMAADVIVVGAPMYNFSVPSQLKAWLDAMAIPGKTFRYSESGVEGLLGSKRVIVASARGGVYATEAAAAVEHQESLVVGLFGFLGVKNMEVVRAEGVRMGEEQAKAAIEAALRQAGALTEAA